MRWTRPETWHLTLLFLGGVEPARLGSLETSLTTLAQGLRPYAVEVDEGGGRLRKGEGVAWLGLSTGAGRLIDVAEAAAGSCPPDVTAGPPPKRTPSAHLTVVRKADAAVIEALRQQTHGRLGVAWTVDRVQLVRSHLERSGARYETLLEVTL